MFEKKYDLIVIGSGAGMNVAARARGKDYKVALVEHGTMGGTCLNRGCIPSKIMIYPADVVREIEHAQKLGVNASIKDLDFKLVRKRMMDLVLGDRHQMEEGVAEDESLDYYHETGEFVGKHILKVGEKKITAPKIMIACGVRTRIPNINGLQKTGYQTSETIFDIKDIPNSLIILGGGYKACEFAHFFSTFGTKVTIVGHNRRLIPKEEPEASELVKNTLGRYMEVHTNRDTAEVWSDSGEKVVVHEDRDVGESLESRAEEILVTTGVISNAPLLHPENTGVNLDDKGYIIVNEYLETSQPGIWAFGDVLGRTMYRHTANYQSDVAWINAYGDMKVKLDEHAVPHAIFTYPQVAGVGMTLAEVMESGRPVLVGHSSYDSTAKGYAMADEDSFVKVILDGNTLEILGATVAGPHAAILVQPIVYLMNCGDRTYRPLAASQIIHPALSEVVAAAFGKLHDPRHHHEHEHQH
ncbi:MAG: dihydrolipoyl dehydrogenase [Methanomassiliicoccales archaeon]|nr:dihydrolipoyl dehydrogenase [Methanomassiliicoccales archaeon]NYT14868.1 dihydrolipoyl dehydrogenase [Methanomassiliicoccales archaeon]